LQNPIYIGLIRCQGEAFPGRHEALIASALFEQANALLADRRSSPSRLSHDQHVHLLKGLVRCADCGSTMTQYPSGKVGKDGERYLYYVCTAVLRDQRGCPCQVRRLPVRRLERAVAQFVSSFAAAPDIISSHLRRSAAADGKERRTFSSRRDDLLSSLQGIERQLSALVSHFGKQQVPVYVGEKIARLDVSREDVRKEIAGLEARIEELREGAVSEEELLERLAVLGGGFEELSLQKQKAILQGIVGRREVDLGKSIPTDRNGKSRLRTRRLLLNISLKPSSSSEGRRPRICAVIPCWGDLDASRVTAEFVLHHGVPSETPSAVIPAPPAKPQETPAERALRFQRMLDAGEVGSRAELARRLGVARSWVTQVLQHLPAASS
jgi:DNA-binding transcriptional regulator YdaS (Cro superfamily)